mgnify:CR=1 FL=1
MGRCVLSILRRIFFRQVCRFGQSPFSSKADSALPSCISMGGRGVYLAIPGLETLISADPRIIRRLCGNPGPGPFKPMHTRQSGLNTDTSCSPAPTLDSCVSHQKFLRRTLFPWFAHTRSGPAGIRHFSRVRPIADCQSPSPTHRACFRTATPSCRAEPCPNRE